MIVIISGLYQGEYIITSHFGTQYTMFPMFPMVDINIRLALPHLRVICRSVSESGGTR